MPKNVSLIVNPPLVMMPATCWLIEIENHQTQSTWLILTVLLAELLAVIWYMSEEAEIVVT